MKILFAGDFCPHNRVAKLIDQGDYESIFGEICEYTKQADFSIVNLEAPIVEGYASPIEKCGPNLKASSKTIEAIKFAGFNMVTLANNHFFDYGDKGVIDTLNICKQNGILNVGGGRNLHEASQIIYVEIQNVKFAFINCCEHEFSIATENSGGSNPLNPIRQYYSIQEAKRHADKVIVIVHGGHEHYQLPSPRMKETYRFFVDNGADAVINHHQHCFSGYEIYNGKPIFYGLGNFCFDWPGKRDSIWNEGYMVELIFYNNEISFNIIPYIQGDKYCSITIEKGKHKFDLKISQLNEIIANDELLNKRFLDFTSNSSVFKIYKAIISPYNNRLLSSLYLRGFLPDLINRKHWLLLKNMLTCNSHNDGYLSFLNNKLKAK